MPCRLHDRRYAAGKDAKRTKRRHCAVDVIATRITDAAQAWLDKELQDLQLGRRRPWAS